MWVLTEDAVLACSHELGIARAVASQSLVTIAGRKVLVEADPENRPIAGCPNFGITIKPCQLTLRAVAGYSDLVRIDGRRVCLDPVTGPTDGTPPSVPIYKVKTPGQALVSEVP